MELLIACRFLQALGGCAPLVVPRAVVRDYFDQQDSVRMLSVLMLVMGLAPILAPLIGGQLLVRLGWRAVFWLLAGYGAVVAGRGPLAAAREPAGATRGARSRSEWCWPPTGACCATARSWAGCSPAG